jgi:hypothetical protein
MFLLGYALAEPTHCLFRSAKETIMKVSRFSFLNLLGRSSMVTRFLVITLFLSFLGVGSLALGQTITLGNGQAQPTAETPFDNVIDVTCAVADALQGPVGIAIGFLVLIGGLIAMQVANRDAIPMITRAVAGTALLIGAGAAFAALITEPCTPTV